MNRQDVRMIERGRHLCLALKAPPAVSVGDAIAQELDRDRTIQLGVHRTIDDSHPSFSKGETRYGRNQQVFLKRVARGQTWSL